MIRQPYIQHQSLFSCSTDRFADAVVTVIVPVFNYAHFLLETLESVSNQTLEPIDIIIVDDCSTDGSTELCQAWFSNNANRFRQAKILKHTQNFGLSEARNTAVAASQTPYVFALDADNELYPNALAALLDAVRVSGAQAAYSQLEMHGDIRDVGEAYVWDVDRLSRGNYIDAMALISRESIIACGGFHQFERDGWEDFDLWCSFVDNGFRAQFVPQILCRYRVHGTSMLRTETNPSIAEFVSEITARHPWLRLAT